MAIDMSHVKYVYGRRACQCIIETLPQVEEGLRKLGAIKKDLSGLITQQAWQVLSKSGGAAASAGTHDLGGVWDVAVQLVNTPERRAVWRNAGWAMWYRREWEGNWSEHGHGVVIGCPHLQGKANTNGKSWVHGALKQVEYYRDGLNGLANKAKDQGPRVPYITFAQARVKWLNAKNPSTPVPASKANAIPRYYSPRPFPAIVVDGKLGKQTLDRLRMQLNIKPTGAAVWQHYDIRALKVWLGNADNGTGILSPLNVQQLQYRVGFRGKQQDGILGPVTIAALQRFLNANR